MINTESLLAKPEHFNSEQELDEFITRPDQEVMDMLSKLDGDIMILGIGGKVGSHVGVMIQRGIDTLGIDKRVYGVSRFSDPAAKKELEESGVTTISCDLLNLEDVKKLPQVKNIIFMAGKKFGTSGRSHVTWAMNTLVPKNVCEHFSESRFVAFSTGCVYDLSDIKRMGSLEENDTTPLGDYSNSAVGRERVFEYYAETHNLPTLLFRLNYAIDLRYGVLLEIAQSVFAGNPIDVSMGHVNVIWQGDVVRQAILSLNLCETPARPLNITGPETVPVRYLAQEFGKRFGKEVQFTGEEKDTALLSNASRASQLFGYPKVPLLSMIDWIAHWVANSGETLNKPTHFETRDGQY